MNSDSRNRNLIYVSHCLLNQNAKVAGLAGYEGTFEPLMPALLQSGAGIIQMPCPEFLLLGPERPTGTDTREQYDNHEYRCCCLDVADRVVDEIRSYQNGGYRIICILGVEGSPSCSVQMVPVLTNNGHSILKSGMGIYMEILAEKLREQGLEIPMVGIPEDESAGNLDTALQQMNSLIHT